MANERQYYTKAQFYSDVRHGSGLIACMLVWMNDGSRKPSRWQKITKADSKHIVFNGHCELKLSGKTWKYYGFTETQGRFLEIIEPDGTPGMLYAIRESRH